MTSITIIGITIVEKHTPATPVKAVRSTVCDLEILLAPSLLAPSRHGPAHDIVKIDVQNIATMTTTTGKEESTVGGGGWKLGES